MVAAESLDTLPEEKWYLPNELGPRVLLRAQVLNLEPGERAVLNFNPQ
jgi:hypothetical protein